MTSLIDHKASRWIARFKSMKRRSWAMIGGDGNMKGFALPNVSRLR